nr:hypothetical protein [Microvirga pakistanensis]
MKGAGGDALFGGGGADSLTGGTGMDLLSGDGGKDVLSDQDGAVFVGGGGGNVFHTGAGRDIFLMIGGGVNVLGDDSTFDFTIDRIAVVGQSAPADVASFVTEHFTSTEGYAGIDVGGTAFLVKSQPGLVTLEDWIQQAPSILEFHVTYQDVLNREGLGWAI